MKRNDRPEVWVGLDWGDAQHSLCMLDAHQDRRESFDIPHTPEGVEKMFERFRDIQVLGVAVETANHLIVQQLLLAGFTVYPVNPKVSKAWRNGWKAQASKTDRIDAEILAYGLRQHHSGMKQLEPDDPQTREMSILCVDEMHLIEDRSSLVQRMKAILKQYYPQALEWFDDWTKPKAWNFLLAFPNPAALQKSSKKKIIGFVKTNRIRLTPKVQKRIAKRTKPSQWLLDPVVGRAKEDMAVATAKQLHTLEASLKRYRERIGELFAVHPDRELFESLPGAAEKLAPRLLCLFGTRRDRFESANDVQALSGTVPVSYTSGKQKKPAVKFRWACNADNRNTFHQFASCSKRGSAWAQTFYDQAKEKEQSHGLALRNLANKWIKIIYRMWMTREQYDEARYLNAMIAHGSQLIQKMKQIG